MALVSLKGGIMWPDAIAHNMVGSNVQGASVIIAGQALTAAGSKLAFIFVCPPGGMTVHQVKFICTTMTTSGNVDVRLETVSATDGAPTGTLVATNNNGTVTVSATGVQTATLTADATLVAGTLYALVIVRTTGDRVIGDQILGGQHALSSGALGSYVRYNPTGGYNTRTDATSYRHAPIAALLDASGNYYFQNGFFPVSAFAFSAFNNTTDPKERGAALIPRVPMRVVGWYCAGMVMAGDTNVVLANTAGTALLTFTGDKDWGDSYAIGSGYGQFTRGYFGSTIDLVAGTTYYLTLQPSSATNCSLSEVSLIDTSDVNGFQAFNAGADCKLVTRAAGGSFTVSSTARPFSFGLIISHLDDGAGGGQPFGGSVQ